MKIGKTNYYITYYLSGHGNFGQYLKRFQISNEDECHLYTSDDMNDVSHTLLQCNYFKKVRADHKIKENTLSDITSKNKSELRQFLEFLQEIMEMKSEYNE